MALKQPSHSSRKVGTGERLAETIAFTGRKLNSSGYSVYPDGAGGFFAAQGIPAYDSEDRTPSYLGKTVPDFRGPHMLLTFSPGSHLNIISKGITTDHVHRDAKALYAALTEELKLRRNQLSLTLHQEMPGLEKEVQLKMRRLLGLIGLKTKDFRNLKPNVREAIRVAVRHHFLTLKSQFPTASDQVLSHAAAVSIMNSHEFTENIGPTNKRLTVAEFRKNKINPLSFGVEVEDLTNPKEEVRIRTRQKLFEEIDNLVARAIWYENLDEDLISMGIDPVKWHYADRNRVLSHYPKRTSGAQSLPKVSLPPILVPDKRGRLILNKIAVHRLKVFPAFIRALEGLKDLRWAKGDV